MWHVALSPLLVAVVPAADWKPAPSPLMTRWGQAITADKTPWPEYPRPQMVRKDWQNLNGLWDYAITKKGDPKPDTWAGQILVPFCLESALSGVGKRLQADQELWYRRTIDASAWKGKRVRLNFEAVDWQATVWVNGVEVGSHKGGSDPFSFDVTDALKDGKGELVVRAWDPTEKGSQPIGKQLSNPHGIWYTPVSGIWQTVWMEPAGAIRSVRFTPDIDKGEVECLVEVEGKVDQVGVLMPGERGYRFVGSGKPGQPIRFKVADPKLWTPDTPHLYQARVATDIHSGNDVVETYFAMRKVSAAKDAAGHLRLCLNDKPLFQIGPLDQGWWPDGLLTPPSDEAMKYDLDVLKKLGFNMLRKHIKVEPARYYHHCDKLGLLVWQDMPSAINRTKKHFVRVGAKDDADDQFTAEEKAQFRAELKAMIDHLRFFPSIYCWVPFNEGWGQHDTNAILKWTKEYDPTRLVNGPSGWEDRGYGDMKDMHAYPGPDMFPTMPDRVSVLGEFGGLGLPLKGHLWKDTGNWGYRTYQTEKELRDHYRVLTRRLQPLIAKGLAAAVYTQTTDVEIEVNGLLTYDRAVLKVDPAETASWHKALFGPPMEMRSVVATSEAKGQPWKYSLDKPADGWEKVDFDDKDWKAGDGGFGTKETPGSKVGTTWDAKEIWLRRTVELAELPTGEVLLRLHHDEDAEVYLNGVLAIAVKGYVRDYYEVPLREEALKALKKGPNVLAVHCKQTGGGQYIDVGVVELVPKR